MDYSTFKDRFFRKPVYCKTLKEWQMFNKLLNDLGYYPWSDRAFRDYKSGYEYVFVYVAQEIENRESGDRPGVSAKFSNNLEHFLKDYPDTVMDFVEQFIKKHSIYDEV